MTDQSPPRVRVSRRVSRRPASRDEAVRLAAGGASTVEIAAALGVHRATVWAWLGDPSVAAQVDDVRRLARAAVAVRLAELAHDALDVLAQVMADPCTPHMVRVRAAAELLDRAGVAPSPALKVDVRQHHPGVDTVPLLRRLCEWQERDRELTES